MHGILGRNSCGAGSSIKAVIAAYPSKAAFLRIPFFEGIKSLYPRFFSALTKFVKKVENSVSLSILCNFTPAKVVVEPNFRLGVRLKCFSIY